MSVWVNLDRTHTGDGGEMTLALLDDRYVIRVDGQDLMNSHSHASEEKLARYGCAGLAAKPGARVLIGGMGMGFTVRAALQYQPVGYRWADNLRSYRSMETERFVRYYDALAETNSVILAQASAMSR